MGVHAGVCVFGYFALYKEYASDILFAVSDKGYVPLSPRTSRSFGE